MQVREIRLRHTNGLHARVAARVVKVAGRFRSRIVLCCGERRASARSIMAVMMLAAAFGATVRLEIEGPDEQAAVEAMSAVLVAPGERR
ncbi:MAG TPA: HPr family phosphocarrier protein [Gemmatimonadaceae bacterium]|nr:HPr family phosphocarrier protein [Gemmatimonadaceae bacterium]